MTGIETPFPQAMGIYVHIPFCTQRCIYCDFYFVTSNRGRSRFVEALCTEITRVAQAYGQAPVTSIYFGGGTPSRLPAASIAQVMRAISSAFDTSSVTEVTLEMNPEDVTAAYLSDLKQCGINRLSVGIQSFQATDLKFLNRAHGVGEAVQAIDQINEARFESWTMDLIFGLPDQSLVQWENNLTRALDAGAPHISTYNLTIEPRTPLFKQVERGLVKPAEDEMVARAYQMAIDTLEQAGFNHYEISSFARPSHRAKHNQAYWTHNNYLGFGPSAHSFWWDESGARRWKNVANLNSYSQRVLTDQSPVEFSEALTRRQLIAERIMLGLRTADGVSLATLNEIYDLDLLASKRTEIYNLQDAGLIECDGPSVRLTVRGRHVCDRVTATLVPD